MSALENTKDVWPISGQSLDPKYEKCRNITEEIYKRINITFQIKKLESAGQSDLSDHSDQIDSNELSNETDLFACDKSDSLSSSTEAERPTATCEKYINININNNEELKPKKPAVVYKRPRKRFRKRVKKRQTARARSDTEGSSDEALPLSRIVEVDAKSADDDNVMGVPNIIILTRDLKPKIPAEKRSLEPPKETKKTDSTEQKMEKTKEKESEDSSVTAQTKGDKVGLEWKSCTMCSLTFRGGRGLRRHMTMTHILNEDETLKSNQQRFNM